MRKGDSEESIDAVYVGMGVATRRRLVTGDLPLDALGMMLVAERARIAVGAKRVIHLIADTHALVNDFATSSAVERAAASLAAHVKCAAQVLGLGPYQVLRASQIDACGADRRLHGRLYREAQRVTNDPYAARQAADVEWARRVFGAGVKIGWTMESDLDRPVLGYDERYFDAVHRDVFGDGLTYIYTAAGRRRDERPRTSPYANEPGERRITVTSSPEQITDACGSPRMRAHLRPLVAELRDALTLPAHDDLAADIASVLSVVAAHRSTTPETPRRAA
ncbi:MAG: hypothetical protein JHD16_00885 [Solirubrobacteraceae bacterium]|nr:hypothetical protein [Solirubrobacteraceae bacterium]